jgi:hypothetical protein
VTTWREGVEYWRAWARKGGDLDPEDARTVSAFYEALALHCGKDGGDLDDEMPAELAAQLK